MATYRLVVVQLVGSSALLSPAVSPCSGRLGSRQAGCNRLSRASPSSRCRRVAARLVCRPVRLGRRLCSLVPFPQRSRGGRLEPFSASSSFCGSKKYSKRRVKISVYFRKSLAVSQYPGSWILLLDGQRVWKGFWVPQRRVDSPEDSPEEGAAEAVPESQEDRAHSNPPRVPGGHHLEFFRIRCSIFSRSVARRGVQVSVVETSSHSNIRHILTTISVRHMQILSTHTRPPCPGEQLSSSLSSKTPLPSLSLLLSPPLLLNYQEIKNLPDDQLDRVLFLVYDMDNIMLQMRTEKEDQDLRKTYGFLFQFLKKNMLQPKLPSLAKEKLGVPPFEKPSIAKV